MAAKKETKAQKIARINEVLAAEGLTCVEINRPVERKTSIPKLAPGAHDLSALTDTQVFGTDDEREEFTGVRDEEIPVGIPTPEREKKPSQGRVFSQKGRSSGGMGLSDGEMIVKTGEDSGTAQAIQGILGGRVEGADFRTQSELTEEQIQLLNELIYLGKTYDIDGFLEIASDFLALSISKNRGSRGEMVQAFSGLDQFLKNRAMERQALNDPFRRE